MLRSPRLAIGRWHFLNLFFYSAIKLQFFAKAVHAETRSMVSQRLNSVTSTTKDTDSRPALSLASSYFQTSVWACYCLFQNVPLISTACRSSFSYHTTFMYLLISSSHSAVGVVCCRVTGTVVVQCVQRWLKQTLKPRGCAGCWERLGTNPEPRSRSLTETAATVLGEQSLASAFLGGCVFCPLPLVKQPPQINLHLLNVLPSQSAGVHFSLSEMFFGIPVEIQFRVSLLLNIVFTNQS